MPSLFDPLRIGALDLPNRVFMAPLTRGRATREHVPTSVMAEYYAQRAGAGLIISEATGMSRQGLGWPYAPGIWTTEQMEAWKPVTRAVHDAGGRIYCQLWHMGRAVHSSVTGEAPVSASATAAPGKAHTYEGRQPYETARPLDRDEIPAILDAYRLAAGYAVMAGFDGVQLHAANGYLIDQFLRDGSNARDDDYGGPVDNRIRLLREATEAVAGIIGPERTAVRLSPNGDSQGVDDSDPVPLFTAAASALGEIGIAFLELREPPAHGTFGASTVPPLSPEIRKAFAGPLVLNSDYNQARAEQAVEAGEADGIAFGRPFISNPDLVARFERGLALAPDDMKTWYSQGPEGYVDYPVASESVAA
ncbi:MAG TPA: alkene reductase [Sphingomonadaceae bacterium]|nr:alkene reductase [Sphingomonadaceae bacterium]